MPLSENRIIIACAGSGKTTRLVEETLDDRKRSVVMVTYTNNNRREIENKFGERNSGIPKHVEVMTWFEFLLRECARPYQRAKYPGCRIESPMFVQNKSANYVKETDTRRYYFAADKFIYSDKIAQFVVECEKRSANAVTKRLARIYSKVFIDEFQDLAGWDLEWVEMLLRAGVSVTLVGDPRQHIYSTNPSEKNKQYLGIKIVQLVKKWSKGGLCSLEQMSATHRCNSSICEFANRLWPGADEMTSLRKDVTLHDGVFLVATNEVAEYIRRYRPQILRYNMKSKSFGNEAKNFGQVKGLEFDRVLIVPTAPIMEYLKTGQVTDKFCRSREKFHVAVTRAKHSVAIVSDVDSPVVKRWLPGLDH